jgi:hypothetical protein
MTCSNCQQGFSEGWRMLSDCSPFGRPKVSDGLMCDACVLHGAQASLTEHATEVVTFKRVGRPYGQPVDVQRLLLAIARYTP